MAGGCGKVSHFAIAIQHSLLAQWGMREPKLPLLPAACLIGCWTCAIIGHAVETPRPDIGEVKQVMQDAAVKIEKQFGEENEDARGLAERVQKLFELKPRPTNAKTTTQELAKNMRSTKAAVQFGRAEVGRNVRGFELNNQAAARRRRVHELKAMKPSIQTMAELWDLTNELQLREQAMRCRDELLKVCLEAVKNRPEDAGAHAWLADAHFVTSSPLTEAEQAAQEALKFDQHEVRARFVTIRIKAARLFNGLAGLDVEVRSTLETFLENLVKNHPSEQVIEEATSHAQLLLVELDRLESEVEADLALLLRCLELRRFIEKCMHLARSARDLANTPVEMVYAQSIRAEKPLFRDLAVLRKALSLAAKDSEAYASVFLKWADEITILRLLSPNKAAPGDKAKDTATLFKSDSISGRSKEELIPDFVLSMPEEERKIFEQGALHLKSLLASAPDQEAAMIHEALCRMDVFGLYGGRVQFGTSHLLDGLRLDPARPALLGFLHPLCGGEYQDDAMSTAAFELQLAVDPSKRHRQAVAGMTNSLGMHLRADELLERCLRDEPEDFMLWNQKVVFMLKRDSSEEGIRKAAAIFEKIKEMPTFASAAINNEDRLLFVRNYILFQAMQGLWDEAVSITESYLKEGYMPESDARDLLKTLQQLRPRK